MSTVSTVARPAANPSARADHSAARLSGPAPIGLLWPTPCRTRLYGDVGGRPVFVAQSARRDFTVHPGPTADAIARYEREGAAGLVALVRAGLARLDEGTGDPGLDRLAHEGGATIISVGSRAELPTAIGRLFRPRGPQADRALAGTIATLPVVAVRELNGAWSVYRRGALA